MPGDRASPSGDWREVAEAMGVEPEAWFEEDAEDADEADEGGEASEADETDRTSEDRLGSRRRDLVGRPDGNPAD
ncbi:hypothetical protein [Halegenticoccus tardaugens]|uniref:hypothetical protein n=1 Tax=Halegenticoccus tardaugens TaxID=2071624 RepID=UPI00100AB79F|nr:hypothetical protein [Halegenticoccus tardaugens]